MPCIETFLFFDLEATKQLFDDAPAGNPPGNTLAHTMTADDARSSFKKHMSQVSNAKTPQLQYGPKITEIALLAVSRKNYMNSHNDVNTFTRLVNPMLVNSDWQTFTAGDAARIPKDVSGLGTLSDIWPEIIKFLRQLKPPVCIIAHNGVEFDFRLIAREMRRHSIVSSLETPMFWIDSQQLCAQLDNTDYRPHNRTNIQSYSLSEMHEQLCAEQQATMAGPSVVCVCYIHIFHVFVQLDRRPLKHSAEGDCLMLMQVCQAYGKPFVEECDKCENMFQLFLFG